MVKLTWLGHSAFLIDDGKKILVDPFITGNPKAPLKAEEIKCDVVAVTHGHGDHLGDAIPIAKINDVPIVAIHEVAQFAACQGVEAVGMNMGGSAEINGVKFTMVPAWHSSGIDASDFKFSGGMSSGFVIDTGRKVYHAGDTCLFLDMRLIGDLYKPEIALLPIGDLFTMNPETAAKAILWIGARIAIPMHYNTFPVVEQDPEEFKNAVESCCDAKVVVCEPGKTIEL